MCDNLGIMRNNKIIASNYQEHRTNILKNISESITSRRVLAQKKMRELRDRDQERKEELLKRNEFLKEKAHQQKLEENLVITKYMTLFMFKFIIRFYQSMSEAIDQFNKLKYLKIMIRRDGLMAAVIQRWYRYRFKFLSTKESRDGKILSMSLQGRSLILRQPIFQRAKDVCAKFLTVAKGPWKAKNQCIQYIMVIKSMQIRFRKHLRVKKRYIEIIEDNWSKEVIKLVDKENEYKEMGIRYNLDKQSLIDAELRKALCTHIVDRQLLRYTDVKFEDLEKKQQEKTLKKIATVTLQDEYIDDRDSKLSKKNTDIRDEDKRQSEYKITIENDYLNISDAVPARIAEKRKSNFALMSKRGSVFNKPNLEVNASEVVQLNNPGEKIEENGKIEDDVLHEIEEIEKKRQKIRDNRRSSVLSIYKPESKLSAMMQFDADSGNYDYNSGVLWSILEDSVNAQLFRAAMKKQPELVEAEKKYEKNQEIIRKKDEKEKLQIFNRRATKLKKNIKKDQDLNNVANLKEEQPTTQKCNAQPNISTEAKFECNIEPEVMRALILICIENITAGGSFKVERGGDGSGNMGLPVSTLGPVFKTEETIRLG